jgi:hypothetical protein
MDLRTRRLIAIALVPPGPQEREVSLFKQEIFSKIGEPSALALPAFVFLAAGAGLHQPSAKKAIAGLWDGIRGGFSGGQLAMADDCLYLSLEGPLSELVEKSLAIVDGIVELPFVGPRGFFLGRMSGDPASAFLLAPPHISCMAACLSVLSLEIDDSHLRSASWKEEARQYRKGFRR